MNIHIYDCPWGNQNSISNSLRLIGLDSVTTSVRDAYEHADLLIIPGVGNFYDASDYIYRSGDADILSLYANSDRPLFGICLGMQLMFSSSEEAPNRHGLGFIEGQVLSFNSIVKSPITNTGFKPLERGVNTYFSDNMYFTHSYYCIPSDPSVITSYSTFNGVTFCSSFISKNLVGFQFHPEKSGKSGLNLLKSTLDL